MGSSMITVNQDKLSKFKKDNCEARAKEFISKCDWSVLPDVNLQNKSEFETYRSTLRNLILDELTRRHIDQNTIDSVSLTKDLTAFKNSMETIQQDCIKRY